VVDREREAGSHILFVLSFLMSTDEGAVPHRASWLMFHISHSDVRFCSEEARRNPYLWRLPCSDPSQLASIVLETGREDGKSLSVLCGVLVQSADQQRSGHKVQHKTSWLL
jgi:hypothetical protein